MKTPAYTYSQFPHRFAGSDSERQSVGDPGHCEACVALGHVLAHPDLGCGDVGCSADHGPHNDPGALVYLDPVYGDTPCPGCGGLLDHTSWLPNVMRCPACDIDWPIAAETVRRVLR